MDPNDIPKWAAKPTPGLHLDVMKGDKLVQKLMIDEKKCYLFGRNSQLNDFCIDHASCSRIHAALVYHKQLNRSFLIDLGSTHGTYIGRLRLDSRKPTPLPIDSMFHFGASTRQYVMRSKPPTVVRPIMEELEKSSADSEGALLGLPETDSELDNLTEFNTAHNRRISMLGIVDENKRVTNSRRKRKGVTFNEEEEIINPEDIDPTVGRFRNLVQTTVIPSSKRSKLDSGLVPNPVAKHYLPRVANLYDDLPDEDSYHSSAPLLTSLSTKLGLPLPNPAPEIEIAVEEPKPPMQPIVHPPPLPRHAPLADEPRKKKYAKEHWPGKKGGPGNLLL